ncbi:MAG: peptidoglycan-binding protein [Propionibacteriaceae bacterium]|nr:peptidoglycan-binding protein [Propionibacteriaceae bacterium]
MTTGLALALGLALVQPPVANAVSSSAKAKFISSLVSTAQKTQNKFGVPASVLIAQAIEASDWGTSSAVSKANNYFNTPCSATMTAKQFASLADDQVGKPYVLGAETAISDPNPPKFDCSELVQWLYGRSGNPITDLAAAQYNVTKKVTGSPKVGDLVFLRNNPARSNGIGHVAVLTKKLKSGEWRIIEARGRAYGVVRTTLTYWKNRSYYAGLRRYSSFALANGDSIYASAAGIYKSGCTTIGSTDYSKFSSKTNSFYGNAAAITSDAAYADARDVMSSIPKFVDALAKVVQPKSASSYAKTLDDLIDTYNLTDYDVVPIKIVLDSGNTGFRVTALQYLLKAAGYSTSITGKYDSGTVSAVKKFQKAKGLVVDGQAGKNTLGALFSKLGSGTDGTLASALNALLDGLGYSTTSGSGFGAATLASLKSFQTTAGRSASGSVDDNTWAALFMALDSDQPSLSGTAKVEQTLKVDAGSWGPGSVSLSYQWYRGKTAISGADGTSYDVQAEDAGSKLSVEVSGLKTGYTATARTVTTDAVANATFSTTPAPEISGTAKVGETLKADAGTWKPTPGKLSYQWLRGGKAISGATKSSYEVQGDDAKAKLSVAVTATRDGYDTATKTSDTTSAVTGGSMSAPTPKISGTAKVGQTLKADAGTWDPSDAKLSYQWYAGSTAIKGATSASYELTSAEEGSKITVKVTGELDGYATLTKTSKATSTVVASTGKTLTVKLKIRGKRDVGKVLRVEQTWSRSKVKVSYQWYRNGKVVKVATKSTFKLTKNSLGKRITVEVTGKKSGYQTLTKMSSKTRKVTLP